MEVLSNLNVTKLISMVKNQPLLWDRNSEQYKHRNATRAAWRVILVELIPGYEDMDEKTRLVYRKLVNQKWIHIRDNYQRSIKKRERQKLMGGKIVKPYVYSKLLKFLDKVLKPNETKNAEESSSEDEDSENNLNNTDSLPAMEEESIQPATEVSKNDPAIPENKFRISDDSVHHFNPNNRHLSFFYGILPTLNTFDDDEVLEFQMGVLQQLRSIKNNRSKASNVYNVASSLSNSDSRSILAKSSDCDSVGSDVTECKNIS